MENPSLFLDDIAEQQRRASCWDGYHTEDRCCFGLAEPLQIRSPIPRSAPAAQCLMAMLGRPLNLSDSSAACNGRYFYVATLGQLRLRMDYVASGLPWFLVPSRYSADWEDYVARFGPTGVHDQRVVGGLCLPAACDLRTAALHLVPLLAPWWRLEPQPLAPVNETHVLMPAPLAVDHELFPSHGFMPMWVSKRSCQGSQQAFCSHSWQFALQEYQPCLRADPVVVAWVVAHISAAMWFYSARMPLSSVLAAVGKPRGSRRADVLRIALTATVIWMHNFSHGSWLPVEKHSDAYWLGHSTDVAMKVNAAFLLLSVHLRNRPKSRGDLPTPRPMGAKLAEALRHAWRRWLRVGPLLSAWTLVYLFGFVRCIPMNNTIKSSGLHTWFSERRDECSVPSHWAMTFLMLHEPLTGRPSPCHNADIFETLFLLDVVTFTIAQARKGGQVGSRSS
eukprot:s5684_g2.t1